MSVILQFIPVLLILFYGYYEKTFSAIFRSVLGRFIAIIIIMLYTVYNKMVGAVVCLLVVIYYQQTDDFMEGMTVMAPEPKVPDAPEPKVKAPEPKVTDRNIPLLSRFLPPPVTEPFSNWEPNQEKSLFIR